MPERKQNGNFANDREIRGESNVWSAALRLKMSWRFDADVCLKEIVDRLVMASSARWYCHELRIEAIMS